MSHLGPQGVGGAIEQLTAAPVDGILVIADLLVRRRQATGGASVLTQFVNAPDSAYVRLIGWSALMPGDPEVELDPQIAPYAATATAVIRKDGYAALTTEVIDLAGRHGWQHVYVAGMDTESWTVARTQPPGCSPMPRLTRRPHRAAC